MAFGSSIRGRNVFGLNQLVTQGQDYDIDYRRDDKRLSVKAKTSASVAYRGRDSLRYFAR